MWESDGLSSEAEGLAENLAFRPVPARNAYEERCADSAPATNQSEREPAHRDAA